MFKQRLEPLWILPCLHLFWPPPSPPSCFVPTQSKNTRVFQSRRDGVLFVCVPWGLFPSIFTNSRMIWPHVTERLLCMKDQLIPVVLSPLGSFLLPSVLELPSCMACLHCIVASIRSYQESHWSSVCAQNKQDFAKCNSEQSTWWSFRLFCEGPLWFHG